jgi:hypothetical protein
MTEASGTSPDRPTGPVDTPLDGPDSPAPPGGPLRDDRPGASTIPDDTPDQEPEVRPSGSPAEPAPPTPAAPQPMPDGPDGAVHARSQAEQAEEELQEENAETSLDQPSG